MSTRILAIDTATEACSVALWDNGIVYSLFERCPREHTQRILPMVQQVLAQANIKLQQLDALAFGRGPGSFTGVRIGIGVAQGLALGANLPLIGVSTLAAMAQGAYRLHNQSRVLAAIDARMGEVYWAEYQRNEAGEWLGEQSEAVLLPADVVVKAQSLSGEWASVGTGWETYPDLVANSSVTLINANVSLPDAQDMLPLAVAAFERGEAVSVEDAQPTYLRNEVTWKKLPGRE